MNNRIEKGLAHTLVRRRTRPLTAEQVQTAPAEVASLKRELAISRRQTKAAQLQNETLTRTNALLNQSKSTLEQDVLLARHWAYHDELTGLPNRRLLMDRLNQAVLQAARQRKQVVVLFIDLDAFKSINDAFGHTSGDEVLRQVAQRLSTCIRGSDTACRYGGDEFVIMLPHFEPVRSVDAVAEKIRAQLAEPFAIGGAVFTMSASIGTAIYPNHAGNYIDLIKHADTVMYRAKSISAL